MRLTARAVAVIAANLAEVLFVRMYPIPAVQIYGEMAFVRLKKL